MTIPFPRNGACNLDKFGIEISGTRGPMLQPNVQYRFRVLFFGFGTREGTAEALTLNTNTATIPSLSFETQELHSYNSRAYFAGKHAWSTSSLQVRSDVSGTVDTAIGAQLQRQLDHYNQTGYQSAADYKFKMVIQQLNGGIGEDSVLQNIHMCGCYLEDVNYDGFDYSSSAMRNIEMTIRPDNVIFENGANQEFSIFPNPAADPLSTTVNL